MAFNNKYLFLTSCLQRWRLGSSRRNLVRVAAWLWSTGLSSSSWDWQAGHALLLEMAEDKRASRTLQSFSCLASRLNTIVTNALFCWPKQATGPNTKSEGREIYSASFMGRTTQSHSNGCGWRKGWRTATVAPVLPSATLLVLFSWNFWNSEIPSLRLLIYCVLIYVMWCMMHGFFHKCWKGIHSTLSSS